LRESVEVGECEDEAERENATVFHEPTPNGPFKARRTSW
jgi:hypothetical protein